MLSVDHKIVQFNANSDYDIYMYITSLKNCYRYKFKKKYILSKRIDFFSARNGNTCCNELQSYILDNFDAQSQILYMIRS